MIKKVYIKKIPYEIDCDLGSQDVCWLAMSACYLHGQNTYPVSRYIPCLAQNRDGEILHPKLVIYKYSKKIGDEVYVKIKPKENDPLEEKMTSVEELWSEQAFSIKRFFMETKIRLLPSNEMKTKEIRNLRIFINFRIHTPLKTLFPDQKESLYIDLEEIGVKGKMESFQAIFNIPYGEVEVNKVVFNDINDVEREILGCKTTVERFPDPLIGTDKEKLIREKEKLIRQKEIMLRQSLSRIEDERLAEEFRQKQLLEFLESIPYSLDTIFQYANKEIPDVNTKDLVSIFVIMEQDEYLIFRKVYEIFSDLCKFYTEKNDDTIDIEALMYFYKNFFDYKREDLSSLLNDFQKYYIDRSISLTEYNFLDFMYVLVYLLHRIQVYKMGHVEMDFFNIYQIYEKKILDNRVKAMYKDDFVSGILCSNSDFLKKLFIKFSKLKFENYYEMSPQHFIMFAKELAHKKGYDYLKMTDNMKFSDDCCYLDFLEKIIIISDNVSNEPDSDLALKLSAIIDALTNIHEFSTTEEKSQEEIEKKDEIILLI